MYNIVPIVNLSQEIKIFEDTLIHLISTRGLSFTIKYVKTSRNCVMRVISGEPLSECPGVQLNSNGWPKWLSHLESWKDEPTGIRALLTLLTLLRSHTVEPSLDLTTVVDPWKGSITISDKELILALQKLGIKSGKVGEFTFPHMTSKKGPAGPAILSSLSELTFLPHQLISNIKELGGQKLCKMIDENIERLDILDFVAPSKELPFSVSHWWSKLFPPKSNIFRKISYFPDKEGKVRVIAIGDYWSQCALRPLHLHVNKLLKRLITDCTFDQNHFTSYLPQLNTSKYLYHSIDLSAATDRMPITLQKRVVEFLYGSAEKANAWENILVGFPFSYFDYIKKDKGLCSYGAGQPMGMYSSWPVMALTHHIIVQVAAMRAGVVSSSRFSPMFKLYALLGDDLVIKHDSVAREYKKLLKELDMPYSIEKTHTSSDVFEFAKRWYYQGQEVTGFSVSGLLSVWKSYPLLLNYLQNQSGHGWILPITRHPDLILAIHKVICGESFIYEKTFRMIKLYMVFNQVSILKNRNKTGYPELLSVISEYFGLNLLASWELFNSKFQPCDIIELIYIEAKKNLVEKDLTTFQSEAYRINNRLNKFVNDRIDKGVTDQATQDFLRETLSVVLNWNHPIVLNLNSLIDMSTEFLMNYWDPEISLDFLIETGLSKYKFSKGTFSMRSSTSITLADSAILKEFISVASRFCNNEYGLTTHDSGNLILEVLPINPKITP